MLDFDLVRVTDVRYVRDHVLWLQFSDGLEGEVDLADGLKGPIFEPLHDPAFFARVRLDGITVAWPNGADWAPETLHERLRRAKAHDLQSDDERRRERAAYVSRTPEISRFFGIIIRMQWKEHDPPHFHAVYGEYDLAVTIRDEVVSGHFPGRALRLVLESRDVHKEELLQNWERMRNGESPQPIPPLE